MIFLGNSTMLMPLKMMLYVFIGSEPENGGLRYQEVNDVLKLAR